MQYPPWNLKVCPLKGDPSEVFPTGSEADVFFRLLGSEKALVGHGLDRLGVDAEMLGGALRQGMEDIFVCVLPRLLPAPSYHLVRKIPHEIRVTCQDF